MTPKIQDNSRFLKYTPKSSGSESNPMNAAYADMIKSMQSGGQIDSNAIIKMMIQQIASGPQLSQLLSGETTSATNTNETASAMATFQEKKMDGVDSEYVNNGQVADIKPTNNQILTKAETTTAEQNGMLNIPKEAIQVLYTPDAEQAEGDGSSAQPINITKDLLAIDPNLIQNGGVNFELADQKKDELSKLKNRSEDQNKQLATLQQLTEDGGGKSDIYVQKMDSENKPEWHKTKTNSHDGVSIDGIEESGMVYNDDTENNVALGVLNDPSKTTPAQASEKAAKEQLTIQGIDNKRLGKITTVNKDGSVEIDLTKLNDKEIEALTADDSKGITYSGSGAISLKTNSGKAIPVHITGNANHANLKGNGSFAVDTTNKDLQVNSENNATLAGLSGENLEHAVINGGNVSGNIQGKNLQAVKIKNAKLADNLNIVSENDLTVNTSRVDANGKDISVASAKDVEVKSTNTSNVKDFNVEGTSSALTLAHTKVNGNVAQTATEGEALFRGYNGSTANTVDIKGTNSNVTFNGMKSNETKLEGEKNSLFVSQDSQVGSLTKNADTEIVAENKATKTKIEKDNAGVTVQKTLEDGDITQEELFGKFFDTSPEKYATYKEDFDNSRYNAQPYGWGSTPGGQKAPSTWESAMIGFARGWQMGGMYNQMYGNPYGAYNINQYGIYKNPYMPYGY